MMISKSIKNDYFKWLCGLVGVEGPYESYWILLKRLHEAEFYWTVKNDDNRCMDGKDLRDRFVDFLEVPEHYWEDLDGPCTFLEMLIALAIRWEDTLYEVGQPNRTSVWFYEMLENCGLIKFTDALYFELRGPEEVRYIIDLIMDRRYDKDGKGGLFPLENPKEDQRKVEIWYQMMAYLDEKYGFI